MRILCISFIWTGMIKFFTQGSREVTGMPAFYQVFKALLDDASVTSITLILIWDSDNFKPINVDKKYEKLHVIPFVWTNESNKILNLLKLLFFTSRIVLKVRPDYYFGFGSISFITYFLKLIRNVPDQRRLYGISTIYEDYNFSPGYVFIRHPFSYLSMKLPATRLFITNDGSHGDKVFEKFGSSKTDFRFYFNGVARSIKGSYSIESTHLSYIGRVYPWKGQVYFLKALGILKEKYKIEPPVWIIGQLEDKKYLRDLMDIISHYQLTKVIFTGGVSTHESLEYLLCSKMTFAFYQTSNFGNVTVEALSHGVPLVTINVNGSLDHLPNGTYYDVASNEPDQIAESILSLISDSETLQNLSNKAKKFADDNFLSWAERTNLELELIR